ncbi:MAG TPA: RsmE family RNA methyltransferase, partial [Actinomycetota bacterium]|nr:RsmE family RNA methyltransferase [Actinomycetota bacterium]
MTRSHAPFFFADSGAGTNVSLSGDDARHLAVVRRAGEGELIKVSDGKGSIHQARLTSVARDLVTAEIVSTDQVAKNEPTVRVFQALAKGGKADSVIQKLVELGVDQITIFTSGRSVPEWDAAKSERMLDRWNEIARGAAKQSHRAWLPKVNGPLTLHEMLAALGSSALFGDPDAGKRLRDALPAEAAEICLIVGPEGGFSEKEIRALEEKGAEGITLGPQILRTETAA